MKNLLCLAVYSAIEKRILVVIVMKVVVLFFLFIKQTMFNTENTSIPSISTELSSASRWTGSKVALASVLIIIGISGIILCGFLLILNWKQAANQIPPPPLQVATHYEQLHINDIIDFLNGDFSISKPPTPTPSPPPPYVRPPEYYQLEITPPPPVYKKN